MRQFFGTCDRSLGCSHLNTIMLLKKIYPENQVKKYSDQFVAHPGFPIFGKDIPILGVMEYLGKQRVYIEPVQYDLFPEECENALKLQKIVGAEIEHGKVFLDTRAHVADSVKTLTIAELKPYLKPHN